ncbi:MAG: hypothetical protein WCF98_00690 [Synechococcus sp. ELA057]
MESDLAGWTAEEQDLARGVFDRARSREVETLIDTLRRETAQLRSQEDIWRLHDFLSIQRHAIEGRAEFRLPDLLFLFAAFVRDGLASLEDLQGLSADKLAKISAMARF